MEATRAAAAALPVAAGARAWLERDLSEEAVAISFSILLC